MAEDQEQKKRVRMMCTCCERWNDLFMVTQSTNVLSHAFRVMMVTVECEQAVQTTCGTTVRVQIWHVRGKSVYRQSCPEYQRAVMRATGVEACRSTSEWPRRCNEEIKSQGKSCGRPWIALPTFGTTCMTCKCAPHPAP